MMSTKPYIVVAGTDFSEQAVRALRAAYEQARQHAPAELHVVHASFAANPGPALPLVSHMGLVTAPVLSMEEQQDLLLEHLDSQLATLPGASTGSPVRVFGHVIIDTPSFALTRVASQLEANLLVVGAHGLHGVARWLLGSVAEAVVRQATCPVLVIPPEAGSLPVPAIEPPCPRCVEARRASAGSELWCEQHRERHGRRHTYFQADRSAAETNFPLVAR
jgi:nucleotide-binding universal stress UspA family protein